MCYSRVTLILLHVIDLGWEWALMAPSQCNRLFRLHHCKLYYCYGLGLGLERYSTITIVHIDNDVI